MPKRFRSDRTVDNEISVKIIGIFDSFAVPNRTTISVPSSVRDNVLRQGVPAKRLRPFPSHSIPRDSHTFERNRNVVRANNQRFPVNVPMVRRRFGHVILLRTNERLRKNCYDRVNKNGGPGGGNGKSRRQSFFNSVDRCSSAEHVSVSGFVFSFYVVNFRFARFRVTTGRDQRSFITVSRHCSSAFVLFARRLQNAITNQTRTRTSAGGRCLACRHPGYNIRGNYEFVASVLGRTSDEPVGQRNVHARQPYHDVDKTKSFRCNRL